MQRQDSYWAVIPAAGVGTRMQADRPKQYMQIHGTCIIEHALQKFCDNDRITGVVVALSEADGFWDTLDISRHAKVTRAAGGRERFHSVLNALHSLREQGADAGDWVLVHDAVRPCLQAEDINRLIDAVSGHAVGGLLAFPVRDTMKRGDAANEVLETIDREGIWHAQTPQMFRLGMLVEAIEQVVSRDVSVTDEAQAMELSGWRPLLVRGTAENIKVTHQFDIQLAEIYLGTRGGH